jgi:hypothetical protein
MRKVKRRNQGHRTARDLGGFLKSVGGTTGGIFGPLTTLRCAGPNPPTTVYCEWYVNNLICWCILIAE